ncbi:MAG: tetratricopeptide repeat protein [Sphingobacteriales bacterium]|jgi:Flp pilus assembly protein TadD
MKRSDMGQSQHATAADETLQRAMAAIQNQRPEEAARLAKDVLNKNPSQPKALHILGYALLMQEKPIDAIEPLEKAFRSLRDPAIETQLAIALRKAGRTDEALKRLARATKRTPPFPAAIHRQALRN